MSPTLATVRLAPACLALALLAAPAGAATLDVMSYNINWGAPGGSRLSAIARTIADSGADVVGVQQVRRFARRAKKGDYRCEDQPARLAAMLSELTGRRWSWTYAANTSHRQSSRHCRHVTSYPRQEGVLILSRYPIVEKGTYRLPYSRAVAKARVAVPGAGTVTVYTVHLDSFSAGKRLTQAREVARLVQGSRGPTFLTGDMNATAASAPIRTLTRVVRDTWAEKGNGRGATRRARIDYVFYRGDARLASVRVIQSRASDHRPVLARFVVD